MPFIILNHTGDDCEEDINGCEFDPCDVADCRDNTPAEEETTGYPYTCLSCPDGYTVNGGCEGLSISKCSLLIKYIF